MDKTHRFTSQCVGQGAVLDCSKFVKITPEGKKIIIINVSLLRTLHLFQLLLFLLEIFSLHSNTLVLLLGAATCPCLQIALTCDDMLQNGCKQCFRLLTYSYWAMVLHICLRWWTQITPVHCRQFSPCLRRCIWTSIRRQYLLKNWEKETNQLSW